MANHAEIEQDLGELLHESLKPYIILDRDIKFEKEELGEGFFGAVLKAEYIPKKMPVAAKFLKGKYCCNSFVLIIKILHGA